MTNWPVTVRWARVQVPLALIHGDAVKRIVGLTTKWVQPLDKYRHCIVHHHFQFPGLTLSFLVAYFR